MAEVYNICFRNSAELFYRVGLKKSKRKSITANEVADAGYTYLKRRLTGFCRQTSMKTMPEIAAVLMESGAVNSSREFKDLMGKVKDCENNRMQRDLPTIQIERLYLDDTKPLYRVRAFWETGY